MALGLVIVGIACIVYGIAVMAVWSGTWFFAVWYALGAGFLAAAWFVQAGLWEHLPELARRTVEVACCAVLAVIAVFGALSISGFGQRGESDLDYIIVLGAQVRADGPSQVLRYRLDTAYDYLMANPETVCIVSGGQGPGEPLPEAQVMGDYLEGRGIDSARIVREPESHTTAENIENSMALIDPERNRVGIVTNDFHVYRGVGIARKKGLDNACGIASPSATFYLPNNLLRESLCIAKEYATGNL